MKRIPLLLVMLFLGMALSAQSQAPAPDYRIGSWAVAFWVWDTGVSAGSMQAPGRSSLDDLSGQVTNKQYPSLPAFLTDLDLKGWAVDTITTLMSGQNGRPTLAITLKRK